MKKKELIAGLNHFDLSDTEARTYLAGLELGSTLVAPLAKSAGIPRTTTYEILDQLVSKNLFNTVTKGKRQYYQASSPKQFLKAVLDKEQLIRNMLPFLESLENKQQIELLSGEAMNQLPLEKF